MVTLYQLVIIIFFSLVLSSNVAFAAGENSEIYFGMPEYEGIQNEVYGEVNGSYRLQSGNELDSGVSYPENANKTGLTNLVKIVEGQKVHGEYKSNTNSCASCHMTHTAVGDKLLFKKSVWNVCTSCHDGTIGELNVLDDPRQLQSKLLDETDENRLYSIGGGTFAGHEGMGTSMHLATGMLKVNVAPGGNRLSNDKKSWGAIFTCSSCHAPHGSYSSRLLHYNPNNVGVRTYSERGYKRENVLVSRVIYNGETRYVVCKENNAVVLDFFSRDKNPWLYGYDVETENESIKDYWTKIFVNGEASTPSGNLKAWNSLLEINYEEGYFTDPKGLIPENALITMDISPATVVTFELTNNKVTNYGDSLSLSRFCAACHNDYLNLKTGVTFEKFSELFGHSVDLKIPDSIDIVSGTGIIDGSHTKMLNCLTCHYAHGTSKDIMLNANNEIGPENIKDEKTTSIKRYINGSVCIKCHGASLE